MRRLFLLLLVVAPSAAEARGPIRPPTISYETGPCFGTCPVYRVTVSADGTGWFEGRRFTAVAGRRRFRLSAAQYEAFATRLGPHRPRGIEDIGYGSARCRQPMTDHPSAQVTWSDGRRTPTG